jgi:hypothetical protein
VPRNKRTRRARRHRGGSPTHSPSLLVSPQPVSTPTQPVDPSHGRQKLARFLKARASQLTAQGYETAPITSAPGTHSGR